MFKQLLFISALLLSFNPSSKAAQVYHLLTSGHWKVYKTQDGVLYAISYPTEMSGNYKKRSQPYVIVSNFGGTVEVMLSYGYTHKQGKESNVIVNMSNKDSSAIKQYSFEPIGDKSWLKTNDEEKKMLESMKMGAKFTVYGESFKSTNSVDVYSLDGFLNALNAITKLNSN